MRPDSGGDIFERVKAPPGWVFQWNALTALNKELTEIHQNMSIDFYENGWRPVPASRFPGVYTPPGYEGAIIVKGMRLEERPSELTRQALREDEARAKANQIRKTFELHRKLGFEEHIRGSHHIFTKLNIEELLPPHALSDGVVVGPCHRWLATARFARVLISIANQYLGGTAKANWSDSRRFWRTFTPRSRSQRSTST